MPVTVAPQTVVNDDGSLTTGTVWNAAWQLAFEAAINTALAAIGTTAAVIQTTTLTGTQNDFALTTGASVLYCNNATLLTLTGLSAGVDGQRLDVFAIGAGNVAFSDQASGSIAANRIITGLGESIVLATGQNALARLVYDATTARWRVVSYAPVFWVDVPYAAGNFTPSGGGTWTVTAGNQAVFQYCKIGRDCHVNLSLNTYSITGTVTSLLITSPIAAAKQTEVVGLLFDNSGVLLTTARVYIIGSTITFLKLDGTAFAVSASNSYLRFHLIFPW